MPITSNVVLAEWQPNQALPAILVGTVIGGPGGRESGGVMTARGGRGGGGLTEVHPITGRAMSFVGGDADAGLHVQMAGVAGAEEEADSDDDNPDNSSF